MHFKKYVGTLGVLLCVVTVGRCAGAGPKAYLKKSDAWFRSDEGLRITSNILSYQVPDGAWPKNVDTTAKRFDGDRESLHGTFDNSATTDELRILARAFHATKDENDKRAFIAGVDLILKAQYPSGGWPQSYPPDHKYHRRITFNDNAMARLMEFIQEVTTSDRYQFVAEDKKKELRAAFDLGIKCILKCQIKVNGKLTAWCAQHDEIDYSPQPGRAFELASISGAESVRIVRLLMGLDHPGPEETAAIEGAVAWFRSAQLNGVKDVTQPDPASPKGKNLILVKDPSAPPLWARFYDIETNKPMFSDRDNIKKFDIKEIGYERRNGYRWYGIWPDKLLNEDYPRWKKAHG